jgi:ribonuclease P protein component
MRGTVSLKRNHEFRALYARGKSSAGVYLAVYTRPNRTGVTRLGLTVSAKLGHAVKRNRIRRRLREAYRLEEDKLRAGCDIVIVARARALTADFSDLRKELIGVCAKLGLLAGQTAAPRGTEDRRPRPRPSEPPRQNGLNAAGKR